MKKVLSLALSCVLFATALITPCSAFAESIYQYNDLQRVAIHDPSIFRDRDGKYYVVGSHMGMAESDDMINWTNEGFTLEGENYLSVNGGTWKDNLAEALEWTSRYQYAVPERYNEENFEYNCWANDVIYNETMGKYCLYGACSVWGATSSDIWLAVSDNVKGPYEYVDTFIYTGITNKELERRNNVANNIRDEDGSLHEDPVIKALDYHNTNVVELIQKGYLTEDRLNLTADYRTLKWFNYWGAYQFGLGQYPNAIDPTVYTDKNGDMWLVYGSYSGGCFVQKLDNATGLPDYDYMSKTKGYDVYYGKRISNTNEGTEGTGEGPYIVYDSVSDYYYFFLTYGGLAGDGGYNIREYRSKNPDGPFVDAAGHEATEMANTGLKLLGNYKFDENKTTYLSGGHSSCLIDTDGSMYQAYHTRFTADDGWGHQLRVHKMERTADGWAVLLPFEYQGEKSTRITRNDAVGEYQIINSTNTTQRKATYESPWEDITLPVQYISLCDDGSIKGLQELEYSNTYAGIKKNGKAVSGSWKLTADGAYAEFKIGSVTYKGVFTKQKDESAEGKEIVVFTSAGSDNSTIWGAARNAHEYGVNNGVTPATTNADGEIYSACIHCGKHNPNGSITVIPKIKNVAIKGNGTFVYDGKEKKPSVVFTDTKGVVRTAKNVKYKSNKNVGSATATATLDGNYGGTYNLIFTINPKGSTIKKLTAGKGSITVKYSKNTTQTTGYQIAYSTSGAKNAKFKTVTVSNNKTVSKKLTKLAKKKKYFVKVRTYKTVSGRKYYSDWSKTKSVKTK